MSLRVIGHHRDEINANFRRGAFSLSPESLKILETLKEGGSALQWERMAGLYPDEIAENYLALHRQHPSTWTQELDLRPWLEKF